jgi:Alw26I/Eco31I/Esp3I family type II restriction m6 adenine DNA methyltransferase
MKNLIKQTLSNRYDPESFFLFAKNLFNEIALSPQKVNIAKTYEGHIKDFVFLGEFADNEKKTIDVLAVELTGDTRVERARSFQRNLIAKYLKDNFKDAGLVAFYSKDNPDWRLSFVKMEYKLTDKGAKVEVGTPPKRYSFLVGETEPSHTAQKQLLPLLEEQEHNPLVSQIEGAFSVEKVTKEFYEKYRSLFEKLSKDLKKNKSFQIIASKENIDIDNFAKKLLGQIVFLYFLQKKGWLGVPMDKSWGHGDKFFLRTLFDTAKKEKKNFYNDYLETLFYDTLNNPDRGEVDPAYSEYFKSKIPFLNGGLFEADYDWKNTLVYLENGIFEDIIDTFDLYNFTVKEDEPLEKEVAVDPEMLGKVFENLLPENLRKGQGAYYTPREIVHYMCQESLINYLSTEAKVGVEKVRKLVTFKDNVITKDDYIEDMSNLETRHKVAEKVLTLWENEEESLVKALSNIKVCDPACGSGAFLVGMLHEIVGARRILDPGKTEYQLKKEAIQDCIYGVDIDPGAVEIAKLRLWLSLVVDYELKDIEPLPNLDYKIMCGNSLLEELIIGDETIKLFDEKLLNIPKKQKKDNGLFDTKELEGKSGSSRNEYLQKLLDEKQKQMIQLHSNNQLTFVKKKELEAEMAAISKELNPKPKKSKGGDYNLTLFVEKAERYFATLKELHKQYFTEYNPRKKKEKREQIEKIEFEFIKTSVQEKVDEINTRIKNLNMQLDKDRKQQAVLMKKKLEYMAIPGQIHRSKVRPYFLWKLNFFEVFQEKGGFDVVIANPPYGIPNKKQNKTIGHIMFEQQLKNIKKMLLYKPALGGMINIFRLFVIKGTDILHKQGVMCQIFPLAFVGDISAANLRKYLLGNCHIIGVEAFPERDNEKKRVFEGVKMSVCILLLELNYCGKDFYVRIHQDKFVGPENPKTILNKVSLELMDKEYLCIPLMHPNDINIVMKMLGRSNKLGQISKCFTGEIDLTLDKKYLLDNKNEAKLIKGALIDKYCLREKMSQGEIKYLDSKKYLRENDGNRSRHHLEERIVMQGITGINEQNRLKMAILPKGIFCANSTNYILKPKNDEYDLKYLLGILNSRLINWYFKKKSSNSNVNGYEIDDLPIIPLDKEEQQPFVSIVEKILLITGTKSFFTDLNLQDKICEHERQIDQMVYKLYGLTEKEIEVVENSIREG